MKHILLIVTLISVTYAQAQKLEDVTEELLGTIVHPKDSTASAAYVYQKADINYDFSGSNGTVLELEYTHRIKIYTENGESYGKFEIPFYENRSDREKVLSIKGITTNLVNGKIVETKLDKKDIYEEKTSDKWSKMVFAMPDVKSGSVIDVKYTITTPFIYSIPTWYFQHEIPTDMSIFSIDIPSYYVLTPIPSGSHPMDVQEKDYAGSKHGEVNYILTSIDVPAIKDDKYVLNKDDYRSGIKYELQSVNYPNGGYKKYSSDWNEIASNLGKADYFGDEIKNKLKDLNPIVDEANKLEPSEKVKFLYNYVRDNYSWNENYGRGSYNGLSKFVENKLGSVGDFNILLQNLLKKADVISYPLVMKSRNAGLLNTYYPTLTELDYVIVYVPTEDGYLLLDASSHLTPLGELPLRAINLYGVIIKDESAEVLEMKNPNLFKIQTVSKYTYDSDKNQLIGTSNRKRTGYASTKYRYDIENKKNESQESVDESEDSQAEDIESFEIENTYKVTNLTNLEDSYMPIGLEYSEELNTCTKKVADKIFIDATLDFGIKKNPFEENTRDYPVFYNYTIYSQTVATIHIPEGYTIESLPKAMNLTLPDKAASFNYEAILFGDDIVIKYLFQVENPVFSPKSYEALKKLYDIMFELSQEKIVLTKS